MNDVSMRVQTVAAPVRQQVATALRSAIMSGRFSPGQRLIERDLCELMGVSRPSVREALRELEVEGLIDNVPNRGPKVASITAQDATSIYQVRGLLEGFAARVFAANATDAQVAELKTAVEALEAAYETADVSEMLAEKKNFYDLLFAGSRNTIIATMVTTMNARINFLRCMSLSAPSRLPESIQEIRDIFSAIERRNPDAAFAASVLHVDNAARVALEALEKSTLNDASPKDKGT